MSNQSPQWQQAANYFKQHYELQEAITAEARESLKEANDAAVKFGVETLKALMILGGGGLVAIPAVMTLVGGKVQTDLGAMTTIALAFGATLIFAVGGFGGAYFVSLLHAECSHLAIVRARRDFDLATKPDKDGSILAARQKAERKRVRRAWAAKILHGFTILFALASLGSFLYGGYEGYRWFYAKAQQPAATEKP